MREVLTGPYVPHSLTPKKLAMFRRTTFATNSRNCRLQEDKTTQNAHDQLVILAEQRNWPKNGDINELCTSKQLPNVVGVQNRSASGGSGLL